MREAERRVLTCCLVGFEVPRDTSFYVRCVRRYALEWHGNPSPAQRISREEE